MSVISVNNLTFGYDGRTEVFDNVSFRIDTDWRLGLVGRNGRGKTTLLRLLCGKYEYSGTIKSDVRFLYFPFDIEDDTRTTPEVLEGICPNAAEWQTVRELSLLGMTPDALYMPFCALSSGEKTKAMLAGLFLADDGFLLIDEPTNHLDAAARATVAQYLRRKSGFILVSHDRAFLDGCVDHILAINKSNIEVQSGSFSSWLQNFERQNAYEREQNERLRKDADRLRAAASRTSEWADKAESAKTAGKTSAGLRPDRGYVGHKAAKVMKRAKTAEARQLRAAEQRETLLNNVEYEPKLKLEPARYRAERLLSFSNVRIIYDERVICAPVSFELLRGERIAVDGANGCGKSSLLKLAVGLDIKHDGVFTTGSGLVVSYVPQSPEHLHGNLHDFATESGVDKRLFMTVLGRMGFQRSDFDAPDISRFSEGQKKKTVIAKSLCEKAHLYIWDEPLNYMDIYSRLQVEALIKEYSPTMLFVEHDKAFRDAVATRVLSM